MKRVFDVAVAGIGLLVLSPILIVVIVAVWLQDFKSPFYIAARAARGGAVFRMVKLRSMVLNADKIGGSSTAGTDRRITPIGRFIRRYKLDEFVQLWNVLKGDMSLVGPRPQVVADAALYTKEEARMLTVRPGITDLASIVFSDEGEILKGHIDPDLLYNQIIRPWKSRLALLYVDRRTFFLDVYLIGLTLLAMGSRPLALGGVQRILRKWNVDPLICRMAARQETLLAYPPPGASEIIGYPLARAKGSS
jgi:lipopolysaccharide/colanic/teichoic acid biosynthesis glycosyltransferase